MIPLYHRFDYYDMLANKNIDDAGAKQLSIATEKCWDALLNKDAKAVDDAITDSFNAQISMFPNMITHGVFEQIEQYKDHVLGWKLRDAGVDGYLIFFSEQPLENAIHIRIRRK
jgi:galactokinase/mevalonate kinase-like predicted kinase